MDTKKFVKVEISKLGNINKRHNFDKKNSLKNSKLHFTQFKIVIYHNQSLIIILLFESINDSLNNEQVM